MPWDFQSAFTGFSLLAELASALDQKRASVEGVKGEVTRLQDELQQATSELARATAERDGLAPSRARPVCTA